MVFARPWSCDSLIVSIYLFLVLLWAVQSELTIPTQNILHLSTIGHYQLGNIWALSSSSNMILLSKIYNVVLFPKYQIFLYILMGQWIADNVGTSLPLTPTLNLDMITTLEEFFSLVECISLQQKIRKLGGGRREVIASDCPSPFRIKLFLNYLNGWAHWCWGKCTSSQTWSEKKNI